ncbi:class I adenylate-forming enzyme family protein [Phreatobacter stygius]|uniref:Acyl--CoA ligase n=1 Tax=Phreatobacter stygius TaxID=1940610 RepID=A0A4D7AWT8_9HYPH|nr:class I adenylate-forming enzyme family protein [Phreatobacter stygius]QCI63965.1 acyl--CoA ligase [Phreatobacter stygius]
MTQEPIETTQPVWADAYLARLASLNVADRHREMEAFSFPPNIGTLLREAAAETPDVLAWNFFETGETITYRALDGAVDRMAAALAKFGVGRGTRVGVMLPNCPQMPTTWLALARIGAVMVPVNLRYTGRELAYVLGDAEAEVLVIHDECGPQWKEAIELAQPGRFPARDRVVRMVGEAGTASLLPAEAVTLDQLFASVAADARYDGTEPGHGDLMNIQYTSGTTGFPKGCMLTHRYWLGAAFVNGFRDAQRFHRVLASTPFFYMDPQWLLLLSFYQRATLFVAKRQSASRFAAWLREHRINFCLFPEIVFKQPETPDDGKTELRRANIYGHRKEINAALRRRFNAPAMEAFGMTEVGPGLYMPLDALHMVGSGSCGIPSPFREARIVDEDGQDVARGEIGELVLRGSGLMLGYYNRPEANRDSFFGDWLRTGDLFRQDGQGYFYIVGRLKDMVRRAGENIAAREVETVLRNMDELEEVAVVAVPDDRRGEEVKAYVLPAAGVIADGSLIERIARHCEANLASFKIPRYIAFVDDIPRTASQKVAKTALTAGQDDLRIGAFDRAEGIWR